jgi:transcriptional regulator with XRE-family HTH domain
MGRPTISYDELPNRIREIRERKGWTLDYLGDLVGLSKSALQRLEVGPQNGGTELKAGNLSKIALALGVAEEQLLASSAPDHALVEVAGLIGDGAQVLHLDDAAIAAPRQVECPRGLDPRTTVALQVKGDALLPIQDGWLLFYSRTRSTAPDALGQLCVVKIAGGGPTVLKQVRRGYTAGRFNLIGVNSGMIEDAPLEWAAKIRAILPPDMAAAA